MPTDKHSACYQLKSRTFEGCTDVSGNSSNSRAVGPVVADGSAFPTTMFATNIIVGLSDAADARSDHLKHSAGIRAAVVTLHELSRGPQVIHRAWMEFFG